MNSVQGSAVPRSRIEQENSENIEQGSAVPRPRIEQENSENSVQCSVVPRPRIEQENSENSVQGSAVPSIEQNIGFGSILIINRHFRLVLFLLNLILS